MDAATETDTDVDCDMVEELFRALYAHDADHTDPDMDPAPPTCHEQFDALLSRVQVSVEPGDDMDVEPVESELPAAIWKGSMTSML